MAANTKVKYLKSPLNYIGGKYKLLPQILPLFPQEIKKFVDLFSGGTNVALNVIDRAENIWCNDNLVYLIDLYKYLHETSKEEIINSIYTRIKQFDLSITNTSGYIKLREKYNLDREPIDLFILVAYAFNHQIRFNNSHGFNTPFGRNRSQYNPRIEANLIGFIDTIQKNNFSFSALDFIDFPYENLSPKDFVYLDPPYLITTGSYNDGKRGFKGWGETEEKALLDVMTTLDRKGVKFALSNVLVKGELVNTMLLKWIHEHENHITVHEINSNYKNSNYQKKKVITKEVLVCNY